MLNRRGSEGVIRVVYILVVSLSPRPRASPVRPPPLSPILYVALAKQWRPSTFRATCVYRAMQTDPVQKHSLSGAAGAKSKALPHTRRRMRQKGLSLRARVCITRRRSRLPRRQQVADRDRVGKRGGRGAAAKGAP